MSTGGPTGGNGGSLPAPPSYALAVGAIGNYDPVRHVYRPTTGNRRKTQAALGKAYANVTGSSLTGGGCKILCIGDSETAGKPDDLTSWAMRLRKKLAAVQGYPLTGTGAWGIAMGLGSVDSRYTLDAAWTVQSNWWIRAQASGKPVTFASDVAGTAVDVWTFGNGAAFTVNVDGAGAITYTPGGVNGHVEKYSLTGLANTTHSVVVTTTTASSTYLISVNVYTPSTGIEVANWGASGTTTANWLTPVGTAFSLASQVQAIYPTPDIVAISLGVNDLAGAVSLATYQANLTSLVQQYQALASAPDVYLVAQVAESVFADATWQQWLGAQYAVAEATGCAGLVDTYDLVGTYAQANANGLMYDTIHPNAAVYHHVADSLIRAMGAAA